MQKRWDNVLNKQGNALQGMTVTVKTYPALALASIYSSNGSGLIGGSYVTTDGNGYYEYYAADGRYTEVVSGPGIETYTVNDISIEDSEADFTALSASSGSSLVGFIQSGTGAVARTVQSKLREVQLSPVDDGALFDSITDDTTAIQNSLNDGRPVYLPPGTVKVTSNLNLTTAAAHGLTIYGAGPTSNTGTGTNKTIIQPSSAVTGGVFKIDGSGIALAVQGWRFRDFTIDMANMTDVSTNYGFRQMGAYNGNYENIQVINDGSNKRGFKFEAGAYTTRLTNCGSRLIELAGNSLADAVTTLIFINQNFQQCIIANAVGITFNGGTVQGSIDKFAVSSLNGLTITGLDVEGTGNYLNVGSSVSNINSLANFFAGFSGTYKTGSAIGGRWISLDHYSSAPTDAGGMTYQTAGNAGVTLAFGGGSTGLTYSIHELRWTRIGDVIFCSIELQLSAKGSSTGSAVISGLPFTSRNENAQLVVLGLGNSSGLVTSQIVARTFNNTTLTLFQNNAGSLDLLTEANFGNTSLIRANFFYRI